MIIRYPIFFNLLILIMSLRVIKHTKNPLDNLEKMLNKTTLVTQRVTHNHIIDVGNSILVLNSHGDIEGRENAIQEAVEAAEVRATRELRAAVKRMKQQKDEEQLRAMEKQKLYFERLASRISVQRDQAEEERIKELRRTLQDEKHLALMQLIQESERTKQKAIEENQRLIQKQMRNEFAIEKELAVASALKKAREAFKKRELEVIEQTRLECMQDAVKEAERISCLHKEEVDCLNKNYTLLEKKFQKELLHRKKVESDFRALQEDYKRFMDYTDGRYSSDYLMHLRYLGLDFSENSFSVSEQRELLLK